MLDKCYILNTPIFFQDYWEHEIRPKISARTASKVILTGESKHQELLERVEHAKLPSLYGGQCNCEATCVYSDKGPWSEIENKINYQNREATKMIISNPLIQGHAQEEFKFEDDEDGDNVDLL